MTISLILEKIQDQLRQLLILMNLNTNHNIMIVHIQIMTPTLDHQINMTDRHMTVTILDVTCILTMNTQIPQFHSIHAISLHRVHLPIPYQIITQGLMHRCILNLTISGPTNPQDMTPDRIPLPVIMIPDRVPLPVIMIPDIPLPVIMILDPVPLPVLIIPDLILLPNMNPDPIRIPQDIIISVVSPHLHIILDFNLLDLMAIHNAPIPHIEKILLTIRDPILVLHRDMTKTSLRGEISD